MFLYLKCVKESQHIALYRSLLLTFCLVFLFCNSTILKSFCYKPIVSFLLYLKVCWTCDFSSKCHNPVSAVATTSSETAVLKKIKSLDVTETWLRIQYSLSSFIYWFLSTVWVLLLQLIAGIWTLYTFLILHTPACRGETGISRLCQC